MARHAPCLLLLALLLASISSGCRDKGAVKSDTRDDIEPPREKMQNVTSADNKDWKGSVWTDATYFPRAPVQLRLRLENKETTSPPEIRLSLSLYVVDNKERRDRQLFSPPRIHLKQAGGGWEAVLADPLNVGGRPLPVGDYSVDMDVTLPDSQTLAFHDLPFKVVSKHRRLGR
jgi:hypothetical protein